MDDLSLEELELILQESENSGDNDQSSKKSEEEQQEDEEKAIHRQESLEVISGDGESVEASMPPKGEIMSEEEAKEAWKEWKTLVLRDRIKRVRANLEVDVEERPIELVA